MLERFINNIINSLCVHFGYAVIQINKVNGISSEWALVKNIDENCKRVIIFIGEAYNDEYINLEDSLKLSLGCEKVEVIKLFIAENTESDEIGSRNVLGRPDVIGISLKDSRIIAYGQETESTAYEIAAVLNYKEQKSSGEKEVRYRYWATLAIIFINILMYVITAVLSGNILDSNINVLIFLGAKYNKLILAGQYYRLITCMFLHGGLIHLAVNMYSLYSIGPLVERIYGRFKFLIIYFASGIISSLFSFLFSDGVSIGASGAIFGLLGTTLVFAVTMRKNIGKDFLRNISSVIIINLFIGFTMANIDNYGHVGGLIGGTAAALTINLIKKVKGK
jgi:rhomboid protease GluP